MRDRLKWLEGTDARLAEEETGHAANLHCRDANTRIVREKDKEKIRIELRTDEGLLTDKDGEKMKDLLLGCVKEVTRNVGAKALFGTYRGFAMHVVRHTQSFGGKDGFRITVSGPGEREFRPDNLVYTFDDKLSLSGLFQRMDNFLGKGLEEGMEKFREKCRQEKAELATVQDALGREFPQKTELALARENNSAVIRELQRMQDDASYVSAWTPKTSLADDQPAVTEAPQQTGTDNTDAPPTESPEKQFHTLKYGEGEGRSEYTVSNQHNGHTLKNGYILRRTYFNSAVGSLGQSLYDDGLWHSTATVPRDVKLRLFASLEEGLVAAREDAARRGLKEEAPTVRETAAQSAENHDATQSYPDRLANAGFSASSSDFYGKHEHALTLDVNDGETYELRVFKTVGDRIGLRVQYEKNRIIDGTRTVNAIFDTLAETLEHVEAYRQQLTAPQAKSAVQPASPSGGVPGFVISSPRMR